MHTCSIVVMTKAAESVQTGQHDDSYSSTSNRHQHHHRTCHVHGHHQSFAKPKYSESIAHRPPNHKPHKPKHHQALKPPSERETANSKLGNLFPTPRPSPRWRPPSGFSAAEPETGTLMKDKLASVAYACHISCRSVQLCRNMPVNLSFCLLSPRITPQTSFVWIIQRRESILLQALH